MADQTQNTNSPISRNSQDDPLGDLDRTQYTYASFIYPLDLATAGAGSDHYMVFHINETSTTQFNTRVVNNRAPTAQAQINANQTNQAGQDLTTTNGRLGNSPQQPATGPSGNTASAPDMAQNSRPIQRVATTIVLYMPDNIESSYHAEWQAEELGLAADFTEKVLGNVGKSWTDIVKSVGASGAKNAGQALNEFTGLSLANATSLATRYAINPHMEVIFNGIGFRQFSFKFRFTPTSEDEAGNVDNIIRAFKFYAAPEIKSGTAGRFWIYPAEFDIQYYANGKENLFLNKISTCALTDIQVNYTAAGHWSAFRPHPDIQGNPSVCTEMTLTFRELEIMTKRRILSGY